MSALNTDLYEFTMAAGFYAARKTEEVATFELSIRRLPKERNYLVSAGLQQALEYLTDLHLTPEEIDYLRSLKQFRNAPAGFFDFLKNLRFTGDVFAMPEGTPVFPGEPVVIIRAPIVEAQLVETYLLSMISFQTSIASKAARCVRAAEGRPVVEFGSRRAHSPEAGVLAGRAAYLAGCNGTSNAEAGRRYGIPVFGTTAHSWTMSFPSEEESFRSLQQLLDESTVYLIDTYNTVEGAKLAAKLGRPIYGVRLDSGDLLTCSRQVRTVLDEAGLRDAKIMVTNDLNERRIAELVHSGSPVDSFGVGTELSTSADAPALSAVYKLVELKAGDDLLYTAKFSKDKSTIPGAKQIYRYPDHDLLSLYNECNSKYQGEPMIRPYIIKGEMVEPYPSMEEVRNRCIKAVSGLPVKVLSMESEYNYPVEISESLELLTESVRNRRQLVQA